MTDKLKKLQKEANQESTNVSSNESYKKNGIVTVSISFGLKTFEPVWAKIHNESDEGRAFAFLCLKKRMRKRDFLKLQRLINEGERK